ncbi:MAG: aldolase/citrate lyase family protein [Candidatus Dactylopiibacterium sp.]|nr:aldolase/citrate lyase family protein [Candidatus Dactylopiibacterium sp.]
MSTASDTLLQHPDAVLYPDGAPLPAIPVVEHYAGAEKTMRRALALQSERDGVFDVTLDCEDGAAAGAEREHAELVGRLAAATPPQAGRVGARIHDFTHPAWRVELDTLLDLAGGQLAYLVLPKARGAEDVRRVLATLREAEAHRGLARRIPLHVILETHGALHEAWQIAALPGIETLDFGLMDFVSAHHGAISAAAMRSPLQFEHPLVVAAKTRTVAAALAHGIVPSHNVCIELADPERIEGDARRAREQFAFLRMWSIHPAQIDAILRGMQPAPAEVDIAAEIIIAAQEAGWGPIRHLDRLHDRASFRYFWSVLRRARTTGIDLPEPILQRFF